MPDPHLSFHAAEETVIAAVSWLRLVVEVLGAMVVAAGFLVAAWTFFRVTLLQHSQDYHGVRLILARYLALALEFQLAADILSTAIAPGWDQIGKLAAIAVIRTALNFFLIREMEELHADEARQVERRA